MIHTEKQKYSYCSKSFPFHRIHTPCNCSFPAPVPLKHICMQLFTTPSEKWCPLALGRLGRRRSRFPLSYNTTFPVYPSASPLPQPPHGFRFQPPNFWFHIALLLHYTTLFSSGFHQTTEPIRENPQHKCW